MSSELKTYNFILSYEKKELPPIQAYNVREALMKIDIGLLDGVIPTRHNKMISFTTPNGRIFYVSLVEKLSEDPSAKWDLNTTEGQLDAIRDNELNAVYINDLREQALDHVAYFYPRVLNLLNLNYDQQKHIHTKHPSVFCYIEHPEDNLLYSNLVDYPVNIRLVTHQTKSLIKHALYVSRMSDYPVQEWNTDVLPISEVDIEFFPLINNAELRRQWIRHHGATKVLNHLRVKTISRDEEYTLVSFQYDKWGQDTKNKALIYNCPTSGDLYFTEVDKTCQDIPEALLFLNNGVKKTEFALES